MTLRRLIRAVMTVWLCLGLCASALADAQFLPGLAETYPLSEPVEIELQAAVQTHMPFDEMRTAQLNALLSHLALRLRFQAADDSIWSRMTVLSDGGEVMSVSTRQEHQAGQAQFSFLPDRTYAWAANSGVSLEGLLGGADSVDPWGLDGLEAGWLEDGLILLNALPDAMPDYLKTSRTSTTITGMGKAAAKQVVIIPSGAVDGLGTLLAGHVPQGRLQTLLSGMVFSGKQTVTMWRDENGALLRADYAGNAGVSQEDLRSVSLSWRLRRVDEQALDDLTLRTPRVKGSGRNNVVLTRTLKETENQATLEISLRYEVVADGVKDVHNIAADLIRDSGEDGQRVTGEVSLQRQQGDESVGKLTLVPDVTFLPEGEILASGMVQVSQSVGSSLKEQADVRMEVRRSDWLIWELRPNVITVVMDNMAGISRRIVQGATVELVRRLVLLPEEDTAFLSAGLEPDVWQQIVDAAQSALQ